MGIAKYIFIGSLGNLKKSWVLLRLYLLFGFKFTKIKLYRLFVKRCLQVSNQNDALSARSRLEPSVPFNEAF